MEDGCCHAMTVTSLDGIRAKLDRAGTLTDELHRLIVESLRTQFTVVTDTPRVDGQAARWPVRVVQTGTFPADEVAVRSGEIVHDLRSSLDHLAYSLAGAGGNPSTAFPIASKKREWR